jgi:hypothetical protein
MMRLLEKMTDGRGSKMFLFKTFPRLHVIREADEARRPHAHPAVASRRTSAAFPHFVIICD